MADVATFNGVTKRMTLTVTGEVSVRDLLSSYDRWSHDHHNFAPAFSVAGYEVSDPSKGIITTLYAKLINGWRVIAVGNTSVTDGVLMVEGGAEDPFVAAPGQVLIKYSQPIKTETVSLSGGGTVNMSGVAAAVWEHITAAQLMAKLTEAWGRLGLDPSNPLLNTAEEISFGGVSIQVDDSGTSETFTRQ
jgi:hypothetical protein